MMGIATKGVQFEGEEHIQRFDSSDWAQRGFCTQCGSSLFYFLKPMQQYIMAIGAFDDLSAFKLVGEIFVDHQPPGYAFKGELERQTEAEFLAQFAPHDNRAF